MNTSSAKNMQFDQFAQAIWEFCRPHTIIGTTIQVLTAYLFASKNISIFFQHWIDLILVWFSSIAVNIYVVGINQIMDIDIDKVNKPYLPLAAGKLSKQMGWFISISMGLFALSLSYLQGLYLFSTISFVLIIGSIYSIPITYLKGKPLGALLAISLARGFISNLGVFLHFQTLFNKYPDIPASIFAFALFNFCFGVVISLLKDTPDLNGDQLFGVKTLTVRIGAKSVIRLALTILTFAYLGLTFTALYTFSPISAFVLAIFHFSVLFSVWFRARKINFESKSSLYSYYMMIWKFFYMEFGVFSFIYCIH